MDSNMTPCSQIPYGSSRAFLGSQLGYDDYGGQPYLLRQCLDPQDPLYGKQMIEMDRNGTNVDIAMS